MAIIAFLEASLPPHCTPTEPFLRWLSAHAHTCVPTPQAFTSTLLGTLSIVSWLFAQMPQIYKNYQIKSTAGLSIFFLTEWLLGDATNLLGALFTRQATWQVIIASYYVFVDICLVVQYFWYTYMTRRVYGESLHSSGSSDIGGPDGDMINGLSPINETFRDDDSMFKPSEDESQKSTEARPVLAPRFSEVSYDTASSQAMSSQPRGKFGSSWIAYPSPRTVMLAATMSSFASPARSAPVPFLSNHHAHGIRFLRVDTPLEAAGTILSWCSTFLYLGSRLPQLYKNWKRQSTAGLSPLLFAAAFCGNLFYSTSLVVNPNAWNDFGPHGGHGWADGEGSQRWAWIARAAPFFLGAAGVLGLDASMGIQFLLYREEEEKVVRIRDGEGHSHWQRVSGYMRGWIPTISGKERVVNLAESQRLLNESVHLSRNHRDYGAT